MKILFVLGLEVQNSSFIYNRIYQYYKNGIDFDIYQPFITRNKDEYNGAKENFNLYFHDENINQMIYTPKGMRIGDEQLCFRMYEVMLNSIKNNKYDLIVSHWTYPHGYVGYLLSKKLNIPCILTAHGSDIHTIPYSNQTDKKFREIRKFIVETINNSDGIIFVSNYLASKAKEMDAINENAQIIPNGIDANIFNIIDKSRYRRELNYSLEKKYIIYAGHLEMVKGSDYLIHIYKKVLEKNNNVEMFIIGDGNMRNEICDNINKENLKDKVHYIKHLPQDQLSIYIGMSDLFILPSRNEGWPCVVNEALACGVPVVGSNVPGIEEAIGGSMYGDIVNRNVQSKTFIEDYADKIVHWLDKKYDQADLRKKALCYTWENQCKIEIEYMKKIFKITKVKE